MERIYIYIIGVIFSVSFLVSYFGVTSIPVTVEWTERDHVVWKSGRVGEYEPSLSRPEKGGELVLVYIGSEFCGFSNRPDLPKIIDGIKREIKRKSDRINYSFTTIGIAQNIRVHDGLTHLSKFAPFDEISTGRGWLNESLQKYVWKDIPGNAATPQVIIIKRKIDPIREKSKSVSIENEQVLIRKTGYKSIKRWHNNGAYIPSI